MRLVLPVVLSAVLALTGCATSTGKVADGGETPPSGDCTVRVEHGGTTYRPDNRVDPDAPQARDLGSGTPVDCEGRAIAWDGGEIRVRALAGVDPDVAVAVSTSRGDELDGVYVAEGLTVDDLPESLLAR